MSPLLGQPWRGRTLDTLSDNPSETPHPSKVYRQFNLPPREIEPGHGLGPYYSQHSDLGTGIGRWG